MEWERVNPVSDRWSGRELVQSVTDGVGERVSPVSDRWSGRELVQSVTDGVGES